MNITFESLLQQAQAERATIQAEPNQVEKILDQSEYK
jgi:hypothetical protein